MSKETTVVTKPVQVSNLGEMVSSLCVALMHKGVFDDNDLRRAITAVQEVAEQEGSKLWLEVLRADPKMMGRENTQEGQQALARVARAKMMNNKVHGTPSVLGDLATLRGAFEIIERLETEEADAVDNKNDATDDA